MILHISFDVWLTLLRSNPNYKRERQYYFFTNWNPGGKSQEEVSQIIRTVDVETNKLNEQTGENKDVYEMYMDILEQLGVDLSKYHCSDLEKIYQDLEDLFFTFEPEFIEPDLPQTLEALCKQGKTLSILSNTGFVEGRTMRKLFEKKGIGHMLNFQIYSDEIKASKPSKDAFLKVFEGIRKIHHKFLPSMIAHVGDNFVADFKGAESLKIKPLLFGENLDLKSLSYEQPFIYDSHINKLKDLLWI